ncbi:hypothetical protein JCM5296_003365 [Sporobolomyces johnsonii]
MQLRSAPINPWMPGNGIPVMDSWHRWFWVPTAAIARTLLTLIYIGYEYEAETLPPGVDRYVVSQGGTFDISRCTECHRDTGYVEGKCGRTSCERRWCMRCLWSPEGPRACCDEGHGRNFILETPLSKDQIVTALHNAEYICSPPTSLSSALPPPSFPLSADRVGRRVDQPIDNLLNHYAVAVPEFERSTGLSLFVGGINASVAFKYRFFPPVASIKWSRPYSTANPCGFCEYLSEPVDLDCTDDLIEDSSSAVNIMLPHLPIHDNPDADPNRPGALWFFVPREAADAAAAELNEQGDDTPTDIFHCQTRFLGVHHFERLCQKCIPIHFCYQAPGETVVVLSGVTHQVLNLTLTITLASDFILPVEMQHTACISNERVTFYGKQPNEPEGMGDIARVEARSILAMLFAGDNVAECV